MAGSISIKKATIIILLKILLISCFSKRSQLTSSFPLRKLFTTQDKCNFYKESNVYALRHLPNGGYCLYISDVGFSGEREARVVKKTSNRGMQKIETNSFHVLHWATLVRDQQSYHSTIPAAQQNQRRSPVFK